MSGGYYVSKCHKNTPGRPVIHCCNMSGRCYVSKLHKKTGRPLIHCFITLGACYFRPLLSGSFLCCDVYWTLPLFVVSPTSSRQGSHTHCFRHPWFLSKRFSRAAASTTLHMQVSQNMSTHSLYCCHWSTHIKKINQRWAASRWGGTDLTETLTWQRHWPDRHRPDGDTDLMETLTWWRHWPDRGDTDLTETLTWRRHWPDGDNDLTETLTWQRLWPDGDTDLMEKLPPNILPVSQLM